MSTEQGKAEASQPQRTPARSDASGLDGTGAAQSDLKAGLAWIAAHLLEFAEHGAGCVDIADDLAGFAHELGAHIHEVERREVVAAEISAGALAYAEWAEQAEVTYGLFTSEMNELAGFLRNAARKLGASPERSALDGAEPENAYGTVELGEPQEGVDPVVIPAPGIDVISFAEGNDIHTEVRVSAPFTDIDGPRPANHEIEGVPPMVDPRITSVPRAWASVMSTMLNWANQFPDVRDVEINTPVEVDPTHTGPFTRKRHSGEITVHVRAVPANVDWDMHRPATGHETTGIPPEDVGMLQINAAPSQAMPEQIREAIENLSRGATKIPWSQWTQHAQQLVPPWGEEGGDVFMRAHVIPIVPFATAVVSREQIVAALQARISWLVNIALYPPDNGGTPVGRITELEIR